MVEVWVGHHGVGRAVGISRREFLPEMLLPDRDQVISRHRYCLHLLHRWFLQSVKTDRASDNMASESAARRDPNLEPRGTRRREDSCSFSASGSQETSWVGETP